MSYKKCCTMNSSLLKFYTSCTLSSWGDRLWFFALSVYFIEINRDTLLMNAINGFLLSITVILFGSVIGGLVDKFDRLSIVRTSLILQNSCVAITCILVVIILTFQQAILPLWNGSLFYVLQGLMIFFNIISNLSSMATKVSVEKDWVIVIADNCKKSTKERTYKLSAINAQVRRLDLTTSILAPIFAGVIMSFAKLSERFNGIIISALFLACWNIISLFIEFSLLRSVYNNVPELKKDNLENKKSVGVFNKISNLYKGWFVYFKQGIVVLPGISLATLFLTVLSFDSITIAYAKNQELSESAISIIQGIGALAGVLGTYGFSLLHNTCKLKLTATGLTGSICQLFFLTFCVIAIWLPGSPFVLSSGKGINCNFDLNSTSYLNETMIDYSINQTNVTELEDSSTKSYLLSHFFLSHSKCRSYISILMLLLGMALSRFGLWLFDLSINQIIQENVAEEERGLVGGVQSSLNQIFQLAKFGLVIFLPRMPSYGFLAIISYVAVFIGFILFTIYTCILLFNKNYQQVPQMDPIFKATNENENNDVNIELQDVKK